MTVGEGLAGSSLIGMRLALPTAMLPAIEATASQGTIPESQSRFSEKIVPKQRDRA